MPESELILNPDGSIYHIRLREEHIADTVILVGDQGRVARITRHFDHIEHQISNREFVTHTGVYKGKRITVLSTGIGTDNIDIVMNELHAAVNIDFEARLPKENQRKLNLVRIGTAGALHADVGAGSYIVSEYGLGFDGLIYYYDYPFDDQEVQVANQINEHLGWDPRLSTPYAIRGADPLIKRIGHDMKKGITATATGFYGPQGRRLGAELSNPEMNDLLQSFEYEGLRILNFEMETSALYGLGKLLGHHCCTCCVALANRETKEYIEDHATAVDGLIETVLDRL